MPCIYTQYKFVCIVVDYDRSKRSKYDEKTQNG